MATERSTWTTQVPFNSLQTSLAYHKVCVERLVEKLDANQKQAEYLLQTGIEQKQVVKSFLMETVSSLLKKKETEDERSKNRGDQNEMCTLRSFLENITTSFLSEAERLRNSFETLEQDINVTLDKLNLDSKEVVLKSDNIDRSYLEKYIDELLEQLKNKNCEIESLKKEKQALNEKIYQKEAREIIHTEIENLRKENDRLKSESLVQLYSQKSGPLVTTLSREIISLLNTDWRFGSRKLEFSFCEHLTDIKTSKPLLVLCFSLSELGNTLSEVPRSGNTALLICHHKHKHALPTQRSDRVIVNQELELLGGIFDVAFLSEEGIYPCEMNTNSLAGIIAFLERVLLGNKNKWNIKNFICIN